MEPIVVLILIALVALIAFGVMILFTRFFRQVEQGKALIINTMRAEPVVTFTGSMVYPIINRAEYMDMSVKMIEIDRRGKDGLICADNIRADINVTFFIRVNKTREAVLTVAQSIGCVRASDAVALRELFTAKFSEALKTVGKHFNFEDLYRKREEFRDEILKLIGTNLNGFILDDAAIDYLEQTPLSALDFNNIMDAEGIKKITDLTVIQNVQTNELRQKEKMEIGSQNLNSAEALFRFEQRQKEAEAKKDKEIQAAQARESEEAKRIAIEERTRTSLLQKQKDTETETAEQAKLRSIGVAERNKEKELVRETELVEQSRQEAVTHRERTIANAVLAKDKELEEKKKDIANVIASRVSVEKSIAVEEEATKDIRVVAQASREKESVRIAAEAEAQKDMVKAVKAAEASEEAAKFQARQKVLLADAELESADRSARAKIRTAEGVQAESAAEGLAQARVKEAHALASEKQGLVDARINFEKMQATANGEEKQGLARVRVREADATAIEQQGRAEATALKEKLFAEAAGIAEKAAAMKALDEATRGHEEFRLRLDKDKTVELEAIRNRREIAAAQSEVLAKALGNAKFQIVGGDGAFFERFVKAVSFGQSIEGAMNHSDTLKTIVNDVMVKPGSQEDVTSLLGALASDDASRTKLAELLDRRSSSKDPRQNR